MKRDHNEHFEKLMEIMPSLLVNPKFEFLQESITKVVEILDFSKKQEREKMDEKIYYTFHPSNKFSKNLLDLEEKEMELLRSVMKKVKNQEITGEELKKIMMTVSEKAKKYLNPRINRNNFVYNIKGDKEYYNDDKMYEFNLKLNSTVTKGKEGEKTRKVKEKIEKGIMTLQKATQRNKELILIKELITNKKWTEVIVDAYYHLIHKKVLDKIRFREESIGRTPWTLSLGNIFFSVLFTNTIFNSIFDEDINKKSLDQIIRFLKNIITNSLDESLYCKLWSGGMERDNPLSKNIIEMINLYFLAHLYRQKEKKLLHPFLATFLKKENSNLKNEYYYYEEFEKLKLKIGSVFYEYFKKEEIFHELELEKYTTFTKKPSYNIDFCPEIYNEFCLSKSLYKPYLLKEKIYREKRNTNQIENDFSDFQGKFLHDKWEIQTQMKPQTYLSKGKPHYRVAIDNRMLVHFLLYLTDIFNLNMDSEDFNDLLSSTKFIAFLSIYDINITTMKRIYYNGNQKIQAILFKLLKITLNFNEYNYNNLQTKELEKEIKNLEISYEIKIELKEIYNKILNNKIFIIGLLKDSILFSPFGFFYVGSYLCSRFRLYIEGYSLNFQNYPLARAFVKMSNQMDEDGIETNFEKFRDLMLKRLPKYLETHPDEKIIYQKMDYNQYKLKEKEIQRYFIQKNLISGMEKNVEIDNLPGEWDDLLKFATENTKKFKNVFEILSIIWHYKKPISSLSLSVGYDATTSGSQMISILFQDIKTAKISNLLGNEKTDIYQIAADDAKIEFRKLLNLKKEIETFFKIPLKINKKSIVLNKKTDLRNFQDRINAFINLNIKESYGKPELIFALEEDFQDFLKNYPMEIYLPLYKNIKWFYDKHLNHLSQFGLFTINILEDRIDFIKFLLLIRASVRCNHNTNEGDNNIIENIFKRIIFKNDIMTKSYNSTSYSRIKCHKELLVEIFSSNNYSYKINNLENLSYFLESYFQVIIEKYLTGCKKLLAFSYDLSCDPLQVDTDYKTMIICPKKYKTIRVITYNTKEGRDPRLSINIPTPDHDYEQMKNSLAPNLIHSMDATVIHHFNSNLYNLEKDLSQLGIDIGWFTIHDMYWSTFPVFLYPFIAEAYLQLLNSNLFFNNIKITEKNKKILEKYRPTKEEIEIFSGSSLNPNFAK